MTGFVLSMLMPLTVALAVFPTLSVAVPGTDCPVPSPLSVTGGVQLAMPDPTSAHVKVTTTSVLFHPAPFAAGVRPAVIVGLVVSTTVTLKPADAVLFAASVAVHVTVVEPSANVDPDAAE